ncbi:MAG: hypothetical protein QW197_00965 [Candidatus Aenigmatarchaeota archaeon]
MNIEKKITAELIDINQKEIDLEKGEISIPSTINSAENIIT